MSQVNLQTLSFEAAILRIQLPQFHLDVFGTQEWTVFIKAIHHLLPHHSGGSPPVKFLEDVLVELVCHPGVWNVFQSLVEEHGEVGRTST